MIEYAATNSVALAFTHLLFYFFAALEGWMRRSSPDLLTWSGFVLYALSAAFLVAVIHLLGRVWTVKLLIARDHVLVDQGLFRIVKHPNHFLNTEAITSPTTLDSKIKKLKIHKSLQTLLKPPTREGEHEFHESRESPNDESVYFDILSSTYEWHSACISKSASGRNVRFGTDSDANDLQDRTVRRPGPLVRTQ